MDQLSRIIDSAYANDVTYLFVVLICAIFGLAVLVRLLVVLARAQWLGGFDRYSPTLLTTLGVLGTFTGIFLGLLDFDVTNIDDSVPQLLSGLKIAFVTSIFGMATMIALRFIQAIVPQPVAGETEVTPEIIHETLRDLIEIKFPV